MQKLIRIAKYINLCVFNVRTCALICYLKLSFPRHIHVHLGGQSMGLTGRIFALCGISLMRPGAFRDGLIKLGEHPGMAGLGIRACV